MSFLFWLSLWCIIREATVTSPVLLNCSVAKENIHLPTDDKTDLGKKQHFRSGLFNKSELNSSFSPMFTWNASHSVSSECDCIMDLLACLLRDRILAGFMVFIFILGLLGNLILFFFLLFHFKRNLWNTCIWNLAIGSFGVLIFLCSICLLAFSNYIWENSSDALVKLLLPLAYLLLVMQGYIVHFFTSIGVDWCFALLSPNWHQCQLSTHLSYAIPAILSVLFWHLACQLLFCFSLRIDPHTVVVVFLMIFIPIMVISSQTLIMRIWCTLHQQGKISLQIVLGILFSLVTWGPIYLFLTPGDHFALISVFAFVLTSVSSTINPVFYILIGKVLLPDARSKRFHFRKERSAKPLRL
ncbi:mas-related G-protein coupled receptor member A2-like [Crotalus tigris]|uniref:mas-related G-protein coupled receptor member A2-like n=1 Tax=Crotalus tigris TaxID=88082 RepID=UPI00192F3291|nr:mas-related G-protein coupled receptor member A2-like [Crotalus tigris]